MPNPTEVHDPRSGGWVAVMTAATTTAILQALAHEPYSLKG